MRCSTVALISTLAAAAAPALAQTYRRLGECRRVHDLTSPLVTEYIIAAIFQVPALHSVVSFLPIGPSFSLVQSLIFDSR